MSNPFNLKVGSIIHEMESNIDHRVIYENSDCFVTILMHSPYGKAIINEWYSEMIRNLLENREIVIHEPKYDKVFDEDNLSSNIRKNRKEESITFMESNTIGSRLNTEETPPMIPMNDTEPDWIRIAWLFRMWQVHLSETAFR